MRKLKAHEKKLLKKVNFLEWKREGGHREGDVMRRYHVTGRDDYKKYVFPISHVNVSVLTVLLVYKANFLFVLSLFRYSGLCRTVQKLVNILKQMDPRDPYRIEMTDSLLEKL